MTQDATAVPCATAEDQLKPIGQEVDVGCSSVFEDKAEQSSPKKDRKAGSGFLSVAAISCARRGGKPNQRWASTGASSTSKKEEASLFE